MILDEILAQTRQAVSSAPRRVPLSWVGDASCLLAPPVRDFAAALGNQGWRALRSSSGARLPKGWINRDADAVRWPGHQAAGAARYLGAD